MDADEPYKPAIIPSEEFREEFALTSCSNNTINDEAYNNKFFPYGKKLTRALLMDKHLAFIGDSLTRGMYKDMLKLLQDGHMSTIDVLKVPNEPSCYGDNQIDVVRLEMNRVFQQAREFQSNQHLIQFFFTSRAIRDDLEKTVLFMEETDEKPDILVMNSAIWDVSRYHMNLEQDGKALVDEMNTIEDYLNRLAMFCRRMRVILPPDAIFIWMNMPVVGKSDIADRGFMSMNRLSFYEIRMRMMEANHRAAQIVREAGFDVLDLDFYFRCSSFFRFRIRDGVHWDAVATRFMNQLLLGAIANALQIDTLVFKKWRKSQFREQIAKEEIESVRKLLTRMSKEKKLAEEAQQAVRMKALTKFELENKTIISDAIKLMRIITTYHKLDIEANDQIEGIMKVYADQNLAETFIGLSSMELKDLSKLSDTLLTPELFKDADQNIVKIDYKRKRMDCYEGPSVDYQVFVSTDDDSPMDTATDSSHISISIDMEISDEEPIPGSFIRAAEPPNNYRHTINRFKEPKRRKFQ